ncbi:MAG TPA: hypothetical protein VEF89_02695 [Solirubrobacteraceae bacterium]|nr:hypothetical protein [Solirubrobacteraceae bacterium]
MSNELFTRESILSVSFPEHANAYEALNRLKELDARHESPVAIDAVMAGLGGTVLRRPAGDVKAEVAAAEEAQREAKKKARTELRDARYKKQKDEIDAKLADLRAKLDRQKKPAASS